MRKLSSGGTLSAQGPAVRAWQHLGHPLFCLPFWNCTEIADMIWLLARAPLRWVGVWEGVVRAASNVLSTLLTYQYLDFQALCVFVVFEPCPWNIWAVRCASVVLQTSYSNLILKNRFLTVWKPRERASVLRCNGWASSLSPFLKKAF